MTVTRIPIVALRVLDQQRALAFHIEVAAA